MNTSRTNISSRPGFRASTGGFTLIELLAVISIIGILTSLLIVTGATMSRNAKLKMAEAQRDQLVTVIESYYSKRNVYPPDNPNPADPGHNYITPLFYELSGTTNRNGTFYAQGAAPLTSADLQATFGIGGFQNSFTPGGDANDQAMQTFLTGFQAGQKAGYTNSRQNSYTLLCVPLPNATTTPPVQPTPWNYVSSNPTNNRTTFDLWVDIQLGARKYRVSNWNRQPQLLQ